MSEHTDRIYLRIDASENIYFNRQYSGPVVNNLDLNTDHIVKVYFDDQICQSWKLNFSKLNTQSVIIWRSTGSWRMKPVSATEPPNQSSQERSCQELKSKYLADPRVYVTFSKIPGIRASGDLWWLTWNHVDIPIPKTQYIHVFASKGYQSTTDIILITKEGVKIFASMLPDKPVNDIYKTQILENLISEASPSGQTITRKIYGGPVRLSQINLFGFSITPENLFCDSWNDIEQAAVSIALILKSIESPGELLSVHKITGTYDGWMEKQIHEGYFEYTLNILSDSEKESLYQISYMIPEKSGFNDIPFQIGRGKEKKDSTLPGWLDTFNTALRIKTKNSWKVYAREAEKQGISSKSIARTLVNLRIEH